MWRGDSLRAERPQVYSDQVMFLDTDRKLEKDRRGCDVQQISIALWKSHVVYRWKPEALCYTVTKKVIS